MIEQIYLQSKDSDEVIEISKNSDTFLLDYIDWGDVQTQVNSYKLPYQVGENYSGTEIGRRDITISGWILSGITSDEISQINTYEELYLEENKRIKKNKDKLGKVLNPMKEQRIYIENKKYYIDVVMSSILKFGVSEEVNNEVMCKFIIYLTSCDALFKSSIQKETSMSSLKNGFTFPWRLKKKGNTMGQIIRSKLIKVINEGDISVGGIIEVSPLSLEVLSPKIFILGRENENISFDIKLINQDKLIINTNKGQEDAYIIRTDRTVETALPYLRKGSNFIQFDAGTLLVGYENLSSLEALMNITIQIDERKFICGGI